jgi:hypothetical protein
VCIWYWCMIDPVMPGQESIAGEVNYESNNRQRPWNLVVHLSVSTVSWAPGVEGGASSFAVRDI